MSEKTLRPRRSLLFVPGLRPDRFTKALNAGADIVCVDIEDAVALPRKQEARELTMPLFATPAPDNVETMVRINPLSSEEGLKDILALKQCEVPPAAIMIAKPGAAAEIELYDDLLSGNCAGIRFHVIIESTDGLASVDDIARSSDRIDSLLFGAVDMSADLRAAKKWETMLYARSRVVHAAARYDHDLLDVPWLDLDDQDGLAVEAQASNELGFTGKASIHPKRASSASSTPVVPGPPKTMRIPGACVRMCSAMATDTGSVAPIVETPITSKAPLARSSSAQEEASTEPCGPSL